MRITPLVLGSLTVLSLAACKPSTTTNTGPGPITIGWLLEDKGENKAGMHMSYLALLLRVGGGVGTVDIGSYAGCGDGEVPSDGPLLTLTCWWAGGGDEFQVRMEGTDTLSIDHRILDEEGPIPEFTPLKTVTIPEGEVVTAAPLQRK